MRPRPPGIIVRMTGKRVLPGPIAAVLDASPYKDGHFHVNRVSLLARDLLKRGVQLWIPRQIVFEWAVHAYAILDGLNKSHERAFDAGLVESEGPAALGVEEIVERFLWRCSRMANVTVLEMDGIAVAAGIRSWGLVRSKWLVERVPGATHWWAGCGLAHRIHPGCATLCAAPASRCLRHSLICDEYRPSRRRYAPPSPSRQACS